MPFKTITLYSGQRLGSVKFTSNTMRIMRFMVLCIHVTTCKNFMYMVLVKVMVRGGHFVAPTLTNVNSIM